MIERDIIAILKAIKGGIDRARAAGVRCDYPDSVEVDLTYAQTGTRLKCVIPFGPIFVSADKAPDSLEELAERPAIGPSFGR